MGGTPIRFPYQGRESYRLGVHVGGTTRVVRIYGPQAGCTGCGDAYNSDLYSDGASASFGSFSSGDYVGRLYSHGDYERPSGRLSVYLAEREPGVGVTQRCRAPV